MRRLLRWAILWVVGFLIEVGETFRERPDWRPKR